MEARIRGELRKWSTAGFGFIVSSVSGTDYFLHRTQIKPGDREKLMVGHILEFTPVETERGIQAFEAEIVG